MPHKPLKASRWEHFIPDRGGQTCHTEPEPVAVSPTADLEALQGELEQARSLHLTALADAMEQRDDAERERDEAREALRDLTEAVAASVPGAPAGPVGEAWARAVRLLEGVERTHVLVPVKALKYASDCAETFDAWTHDMPGKERAREKARRYGAAFLAASRGEYVSEWPA